LILYIYYRLLVHAITIITCPYVHALSSCLITHLHVFFLRLPCFLHMLWRHTLNLHYTCAHHVYTMRNHSPLTSSLTLTPSKLFLILLDHSSLCHMLSIRCRLIIILSIYVQLILTLAKVCPYSHLITFSMSSFCQARFTPGWKFAKWTWRWADLWNDLAFSLCAALSVCCVVATSYDRKKSKIGVSADWCVVIEHWRSSSIRVIFIDYQISELQCNY